MAELDENIHTIYDPDGVGALQISAYMKQDGDITEKELLNKTQLNEKKQQFLRKDDWGQFKGFQLVYKEKQDFWRKWWLMNKDLFLFVTYNCEIEDEEVEFESINKSLNTLKRKH